jgi:protein SCO1
MARFLPLLFLTTLFVSACGHKAEPNGPAKHYQVSGTIMSVNQKAQSASIDAAEIPGYMEAMKMDYPVANKSDLEKLHAGDHIVGALDVYDSGDYLISSFSKIEKAPGK